jgi:hypothetical protein
MNVTLERVTTGVLVLIRLVLLSAGVRQDLQVLDVKEILMNVCLTPVLVLALLTAAS